MNETNTQLSSEIVAKLAKLTNHATLYELAAIRGDVRILIRYTNRKTRRSILDNCRDFADQLIAITGTPEIIWGKTSAAGATCGDWTIRFTGRTEREAIINGELPFIKTHKPNSGE